MQLLQAYLVTVSQFIQEESIYMHSSIKCIHASLICLNLRMSDSGTLKYVCRKFNEDSIVKL